MEAIKRLRDDAGVPISDDDSNRIYNVIQKRNKLQHHGLNESAEAIQSVAAQALSFLITFVSDELRDHDALLDDPVEEALEQIRSKLSKIELVVTTRMESLSPRVSTLQPGAVMPDVQLSSTCLGRNPYLSDSAASEQRRRKWRRIALEQFARTLTRAQRQYRCINVPSATGTPSLKGTFNHRIDHKSDVHSRDASLYWICFAEKCAWPRLDMGICQGCLRATTELDDHYNSQCSYCYDFAHTYADPDD